MADLDRIAARLTELLVGFGVVLICAMVTAPPAAAHVGLQTDPVSGSRLATAPTHLRLEFSQPVRSAMVKATLRDSDGTPIVVHGTGPVGRMQRTYVYRISQPLPRASYFIDIAAFADGHAMHYRVYFVVGSGRIVKQGSDPIDSANHAQAMLRRTAEPLALIALLAIGVLFAATILGAAPPHLRIAARTARFGIWAGAVAVLMQLVASALNRSGSVAWSMLWSTQTARLLLLRLVTFGAICLIAQRLVRLRPGSTERFTAENALSVSGLLLVLSYAGVSKAAGDDWAFLTLMAQMIHIAAVSLWGGCLVLLHALVIRSAATAVSARTIVRVTRLTTWVVGSAVGSGVFLSFRLTDSLDPAAVQSRLGPTLLAKCVLVGLLVICEWRTRRAARLLHRFRHPGTGVTDPRTSDGRGGNTGVDVLTRPPIATVTDQRRDVASRVRTETAVAGAVLIASSVLAAWT